MQMQAARREGRGSPAADFCRDVIARHLRNHVLYMTVNTMERCHDAFMLSCFDVIDLQRLLIGGRRLKVLADLVNCVAGNCYANWWLEFQHDRDFSCIGVEVRLLEEYSSSEASFGWIPMLFPDASLSELSDDSSPPMRVAADMQSYTYAEFEEYYREHAPRMWQLALPLDTDS